jgi:cell wall-associated NlpC family hydrolase
MLDTALQLRGSPYRNGGSGPDGFDCSGFTQYVFGQHALHLPRETRDQFRIGESIRRRDVAPGDLLFFTTSARGASHVAIAINDDEFVHAPSSTGTVRIERLSSTYWSRRFLGARRITPP